jgi:hypothetical protein
MYNEQYLGSYAGQNLFSIDDVGVSILDCVHVSLSYGI